MTEEEIDEKYNHDLNDLIRRHIAHEVSEEEYKQEWDRIGREYEEGIKQLNTKKVRAKAKSALKKEEKKMTPDEIEQEFNKKLDELIKQKRTLPAEEYAKKRSELQAWKKEQQKKLALEDLEDKQPTSSPVSGERDEESVVSNTTKIQTRGLGTGIRTRGLGMTNEEDVQTFKQDKPSAQKQPTDVAPSPKLAPSSEPASESAPAPEPTNEEEKKMTPGEATKKLLKLLDSNPTGEDVKNNLPSIKELIQQGANPNKRLSWGPFLKQKQQTIAIALASGADEELMKSLEEHNSKWEIDNSPLELAQNYINAAGNAAFCNNEDALNFFAQNHPRLLQSEDGLHNHERPLDLISDQELRKRIEELLQKKAEIRKADVVPPKEEKKMTADEATKELEKLIVSLDSPNKIKTSVDKIKDLISKGANPNAKVKVDNLDELIPITYLLTSVADREMMEFLQKHGAEWEEIKPAPRITAAHYAAYGENEEALKFLIEKNPDIMNVWIKEEGKTIRPLDIIQNVDMKKRISDFVEEKKKFEGREADVVENEGKPASEPEPKPAPESTPEPEPEPSPVDGGTPPPETPVPPENDGNEEEEDSDSADGEAYEDDGEIDQEKLNIQQGILDFWKEIEKTNPELYNVLEPFVGTKEEMKDHPELVEEKRKAMQEEFNRNTELFQKYKDAVSKILETEDGKNTFYRIFKDRTGNVSMDNIINVLTGNGNSSGSGNNGIDQPTPASGPGLGKRLGDALKGATDEFFKNVFEANHKTAEDFAEAFLFNLLAYPLNAANILLTKEYEDDEKKLLKKILNEMKNKDNGGRDGRDGEDGRGGGEHGGGDRGGDRSGSSDAYVALAEANARAAEANARATEAQARATEAQARAAEARAKADADATKYINEANTEAAKAARAAAEAAKAAAEANKENAGVFTTAVGELAKGMKEAAKEQAQQFAEAFDKISKENRDFLEKNSAFLKDIVEKMMNSNDETRKMISDSLKEAISAFKEGNKGDSADAVQKALDTCKEIIVKQEESRKEIELKKLEQEKAEMEKRYQTELDKEKEETKRAKIKAKLEAERAKINKEKAVLLAKNTAFKANLTVYKNGNQVSTDKKQRPNSSANLDKKENLPFNLPANTPEKLKNKIQNKYEEVLASDGNIEEKAEKIAQFLNEIDKKRPAIQKLADAYTLIAKNQELLDSMHIVKKGDRKGELYQADIKALEKKGLDASTVKMALGLRKRLAEGSKAGDPNNNKRGKGRD